MPKYLGGNNFTHGSFPEVGQKQKTEEKKREGKKRPKVGHNNGQATHGARNHTWRTQAAWANFLLHCHIIVEFCQSVKKNSIIFHHPFNVM